MTIRKAQFEDAAAIRALIINAVQPQSNPDFNEEGVKQFLKPNEISAIQQRLQDKDYLTLCFCKDKVIVGIIAMHQHQFLSQLFVSPDARRMKVSRQLWQAAKAMCEGNGHTGDYQVKSSSMAVPVYQSFGFKLKGGRQQHKGMVYYAMTLEPAFIAL